MAARIDDIRALAAIHARDVCDNPESWMSYLNAASRFYRYPFVDSFLIHAQRPSATACVSLPEWNDKFGRWVNRGATGIALIDDNGPKLKLRYVFDVKDTHRVKEGKHIYLWRVDRKHEPKLRDHLRETYNLTTKDGSSIPKMLMSLAKQLTGENIRQAMYDLNKNKGNSYIASMDEVALLEHFSNLVEQSLSYVLMQRCGYHPTEHMDENCFRDIRMFDDISILPYLGEAVHSIAEPVLMDIGRTVHEMNLIEQHKEWEAAPVKGQMEFDLEDKHIVFEMKQEDHHENHGYVEISGDRGLSVPSSDDGGEKSKTAGREDDSGADPGTEKKGPDKTLTVSSDREDTIGEVVAATIMLPLLPSPEEQQELIEKAHPKDKDVSRPETKAKQPVKETSSKKRTKKETDKTTPLKERLAVKKKEADIINSKITEQKTSTRSKATAR